jgi:acyl-CoA synthetase (NDP forming)
MPEALLRLKPFFEPNGIAVIGARSSTGFGFGIPVRLMERGWGDRTYLVNPKGGEMHGLPVYKSAIDLPDPVDLAVVIVPGPAVPEIMDHIAKRGIKHVIIESAGFAETGSEGKAVQDKILALARFHGIRIIGPNCVGVLNTANGFSTVEIMPESYTPGNLAVIAQSGVFGQSLMDRLYKENLFFSKVVTLGNRMDVNESEILEYLHQDHDTKMIVMYIEGAANGRLLKQTLNQVTKDKPVIVLKSGRTSVGRAATASHTGSLSGEDALYESMFLQSGAVRVETLNEFMEFSRVFITQPLPNGNRLGIVTGSGSLGALAADAALASGLTVPPLPDRVRDRVLEGAPGWMNAKNPLDVGPSNQFPKAFNALMSDPDIDMVLAIIGAPYAVFQYMGGDETMVKRFLGDTSIFQGATRKKPYLICVFSHDELVKAVKSDVEPDIPVFTNPEMPVRALAALWRLSNWRRQHSGR